MIKLLREELLVMAKSTELSGMEAESIVNVAKNARSKEAYNRLYSKAMKMARNK
jgi:hypothetical protein